MITIIAMGGIGVVQSSSLSYGCHYDEMRVASNYMIPLLDRDCKCNPFNRICTVINTFGKVIALICDGR